MFNFLRQAKFLTILLVLVAGGAFLPEAKAQPIAGFAIFGPDEKITTLDPNPQKFVINGDEVPDFCEAFRGCQVAVLNKGKVNPAPKSVRTKLGQEGFTHKTRKINGGSSISRFTPIKLRKIRRK